MTTSRASAPNDRPWEVARAVRVRGSLTRPEGAVQPSLDGWRRGTGVIDRTRLGAVELEKRLA